MGFKPKVNVPPPAPVPQEDPVQEIIDTTEEAEKTVQAKNKRRFKLSDTVSSAPTLGQSALRRTLG